LEDSKDKVRRNLVVFCSLILIAKYLGVRLETPEISIASIIKYQLPHPENILFVLLILQVYLAYRFFLLDETQKEIMDIKNTLLFKIINRNEESIKLAILDRFRGKDTPRVDVQFATSPPEVAASAPLVINTVICDPKNDYLLWKMFASVSYEVEISAPKRSITTDPVRRFKVKAKVRLSTIRSIRFLFSTLVKTFLTWKFSEVALPAFLLFASFFALVKPLIY
jgi:hypothetical protein